MKLSARDKQRLQWALAVLIGGGAILYACIHLLVRPLVQARDEGKNRLAEFRDRNERALVDLRGLSAAKAECARIQAELDVATNRFVVRPVLGSTLVSVQNVVEPIAADCGLQIESWVERGRVEMPVNKKDAGLAIERYVMEIAGLGSYGAVRDFVAAVEMTNSYACVSDVEIFGRAEDAAKHKVRICIEWPVFGERKAVETSRGRATGGRKGPEEQP